MSDQRVLQSFGSTVDDTLSIEPAKAAQYLLYIIAGLFFTTLVWASVAKLDRVTRGQGRVVTTNQLQEVQYFEGGIVKEILVSAGQHVEAGELLIKLDPTQMSVDFNNGREGYNLLAARITRLEAEASLTSIAFDADLVRAAPRIVANERALFEARKAELDASLEVGNRQLFQKGEALADVQVSLETAREALTLADQELGMMQNLVAKGIEPRMELLRAKQREAAARGDVQRGDIAVKRTISEVAQAEDEIESLRKAFAAEAADALATSKAELEKLKSELPALEDKVIRTDVRAPVAGVVNRVLVATVGGVVVAGETIVEIVPSEDSLLVEAKIKPSDIGFLQIGQEVKVNITAYDSSVYGALDGAIETISPDAILDEKTGESFYNIKVRTNAEILHSKRGDLKILPGMGVEVAILNGKRTVLAYILKPLSNISQKALRDK